MTTKLMISVCDAAEARAALAGGADLIDIKNPREGALGAPAPGVIAAIRQELPAGHAYSLALGEFPGQSGAAGLAALGAAAFGPAFVKLAFLPQSSPDALEQTLAVVGESLEIGAARGPNRTRPALVAGLYADLWAQYQWRWPDFLQICRRQGLAGCLLDTRQKQGQTLLDFLAPRQIAELLTEAREAGLFCALAGSLRAEDLPVLLALQPAPSIIGLRGAACGGDRLGHVHAEAVAALKELVAASSARPQSTSPAHYPAPAIAVNPPLDGH